MKNSRSKRIAQHRTLHFSPYSWAKLLFMRDRGDTEVGGFGISCGDDLLRIDDFQLVRQSCTQATVEFDDESVADFFDRQVDAGLSPQQFGRCWIHTHPGECALPSQTDEETFARVFGGSNWALMVILAQQGECYARLQLNVGPGASQLLEIEVDYSEPFAGTDREAWEEEYLGNVQAQNPFQPRWWDEEERLAPLESPAAWHDAWHSYSDDEFTELSEYERF